MRTSDGPFGVLKQLGHDGAAFCQQAWLRRWLQQGGGIPLASSDSARRSVAVAVGHQRVRVQSRPGALLEAPQPTLKLLVPLLAHAARLDRRYQGVQVSRVAVCMRHRNLLPTSQQLRRV